MNIQKLLGVGRVRRKVRAIGPPNFTNQRLTVLEGDAPRLERLLWRGIQTPVC